MPAIASDETIRELRATIDGHRNGALALQALEALAAIRDDRVLHHIHAVATHGKGKLGKRAVQILEDISRQRGLTPDELEDRIVPELGLDERGTMTFDYGRRRFSVGFDEQLEPFVRDDAGNRLAAIPRAGAGDDPDKAAHAALAWKELKDDVKAIGREQSLRLERAMCAERQWSAEALANRLVSHRLLGHLARRLVFATHKRATAPSPGRSGSRVVMASGFLETTFRVAEDGSYDDGERTVSIPPDARVVIAHAAMLDEPTRERWRRAFDDYRIVQPFAQIGRELVVMPADEIHTTRTRVFSGLRVRSKSFWGLKHRGWDIHYGVTKRLSAAGPRTTAVLEVQPSLGYGPRPTDEDHVIGVLSLSGLTFAALAPIMRAELLRDVELLRQD
jgi:hypothetical protein